MMTLYELQRRAEDYLGSRTSEQSFREELKNFASDYSTHAELDRLATMLTRVDKPE